VCPLADESADTSSPPTPRRRRRFALALVAMTLVGFGAVVGVVVARSATPAPRRFAHVASSPHAVQGTLQTARTSLFAGQYEPALAAYQAVLAREPQNVDALAHSGLILGLRGEIDEGLKRIDLALTRSPDYPPALLYRGQILYEAKKDTTGAVQAWTKLATLLPPGDDRTRVTKMIADAKAGTLPRP
jgi:tetratricopeptide (TPR) repeat protein